METWDVVLAVMFGLALYDTCRAAGRWSGRRVARWKLRRRLPELERVAAMERELARDRLAAALDAAGVSAEDREAALVQADLMMRTLTEETMAIARRQAGVET